MAEYNNHIDEELFERIEAYILERMEPADRISFETEMQRDETLRNEVILQRKLIGTVEILSGKQLFATNKSIPLKKTNRSWLYVAAAAVVIVLLLRQFYTPPTTTEGLFADFFEQDTGLPVVMSSDEHNYTFYDGMVSYKEEDYKKALQIWEQIANPSDTLLYYTGMAYLNSDDLTNAIRSLERVATDEDSQWHQKAIWYLALSLLKQNRLDDTKKWLNKIPENEQAVLLLKEIQKL